MKELSSFFDCFNFGDSVSIYGVDFCKTGGKENCLRNQPCEKVFRKKNA